MGRALEEGGDSGIEAGYRAGAVFICGTRKGVLQAPERLNRKADIGRNLVIMGACQMLQVVLG